MNFNFQSLNLRKKTSLAHGLKFSFSILFLTLSVTFLLRWVAGIGIYKLISDPAEVGQISPFTGFFSYIGIFQWSGAASICFFTANLVKSNAFERNNWKSGFLFLGLLNLFLLFDDTFQLHESYHFLFTKGNEISPLVKLTFELVFFCIYPIFLGLFAFCYRKFFLRTNLEILLLAVLFFILSTLVDAKPDSGSFLQLAEESFKLLGTSTWLMYLIDSCRKYIHQFYLKSE